MSTLIESLDFELFNNDLKELLLKLQENIESNTNNLTKIECCKCLSLIADRLKNNNELVLKFYNKDFVENLRNLMRDKTSNLANAASKAFKVWSEIEKIYKEINKKNLEPNSSRDKPQSKSMARLDFVKDMAKLLKCSTPELAREEIYSKGIMKTKLGITNLLRTSDFLNKNKKEKLLQTSTKYFVNKEKIKSSLSNNKKNNLMSNHLMNLTVILKKIFTYQI